MRVAALCSFLAVFAWTSLAAARPPLTFPSDPGWLPVRPSADRSEERKTIIVEGCVQGTRLDGLVGVPDRVGQALGITQWTLYGSAEVMRLITAQFDRHHVEVTGFFVHPMSLRPRQDRVESKRLDEKTRVTVVSSRGPRIGEPTIGRLEVTSVRLLNERCG